jgi:glycosyltransferase involved in cell wall biosynthesis
MARLAVDATAVAPGAKGIGRVAKGAVAALVDRGIDVVALAGSRPAVVWEQVGLVRAARRHDVVLTFTERLPVVPGGRFAVWLFELPAHRIRENRDAGWYQRGSDLVTRALWKHSLRRAWRVAAGSESTARELRDALPDLEIRVVYPGLDPRFSPGEGRATDRYVFHLGSSDPRDNTAAVVRAFALARDRAREPVRLVVAGGATGPAADSVEFRGRVPDDQLVALYRGASAYLDATLYEGFGYQPLEAMACGTPVIASNRTSIPEIVGDAAVLCDPGEAEEMVTALTRVLADSAYAGELRARGIERAREFTWERTAAALAELLEL